MKLLRTLFFLQLGLFVTGALAGRLPASYPDDFQHAGTLDRIDLQNRTLVVSDMLREVVDYVHVHDGSGRLANTRRLRKGMEIGYRTQSAGQGGAIVEIWILPDGYLASQRDKRRY